jgi:hypothetical protein
LVDRGIPKEFIEIVGRALKRNPDERYASADDMLLAVQACLDTVSGTIDPDSRNETAARRRKSERIEKVRRIAYAAYLADIRPELSDRSILDKAGEAFKMTSDWRKEEACAANVDPLDYRLFPSHEFWMDWGTEKEIWNEEIWFVAKYIHDLASGRREEAWRMHGILGQPVGRIAERISRWIEDWLNEEARRQGGRGR